ncbi:MAG: YhcH/YjgK/YiaL family protein [Gallionellaceae bacterium]|jgi:YhcH/YjgK/YiaL family protein|nr:YhcH/YjgK/YiaL family protein [Gallionellaceae bacterium]
MILSSLSGAFRYANLHPLFPRAFDVIRNTDLFNHEPGRFHLLNDDLILIVEHVQGKPREHAQLEAHRRYIDIQLALDGDETMGWKPLVDCLNPVSDYSEEKDIQFFFDAPASWIAVPPDHFCIFFPEDAHAPLVAAGSVRKAIFKVAVEPVK